MQDSKQLELSLKTLAATLFLGVAGDLLLRDVSWGIGFALYAFVILAVGCYLYRNRTQEFGKGVLWVIPPALLFASLFAWRNSDDLKLLNGACFVLLIGALALRARTGHLAVATLIDYPCRLIERWIAFLSDFFPLLNLEGRWPEVGKKDLGKKVSAIFRGCLIAAPLLLVFAVLFASSDAVFQVYVNRAFSFDALAMASHLLVGMACVWVTGGFLRRLFLDPTHSTTPSESPRLHKVGITEVTIVLATLNALFLAFVAVQFRYLFGGSNLVQTTAHLSYADYARNGFFELLCVAGLGMGVLVGAHQVMDKEKANEWRAFASLSLGLIALTFVVMASAVIRMHLYVDQFGITRDRLYALAALFWLGLVFAWFCATTLRKRSERFAPGALAGMLIIVIALNCLNPDAAIVTVNTSRSVAQTDVAYLTTLSADATPQLLSRMPRLSQDARSKVTAGLKRQSNELRSEDWRSWDIGSEKAAEALRAAKL